MDVDQRSCLAAEGFLTDGRDALASERWEKENPGLVGTRGSGKGLVAGKGFEPLTFGL